MNIRGIEFLRKLNLPAPKGEMISRDSNEFDLVELYKGAEKGATILVFDYTEPINQNPLLEKNVRQYKIVQDDYSKTLDSLIGVLAKKGVDRRNMKILTHQTYTSEDIVCSGRVALEMDSGGQGLFMIEAIESLRLGSSDFEPSFVYLAPVSGGRMSLSLGSVLRGKWILPEKLFRRLIKDIYRIPGNPHMDFEVYSDTGNLFYHDLFLAQGARF